MKQFNISIEQTLISQFLSVTKPDVGTQAVNVLGNEWFSYILTELRIAENNEDIDLQVNKNRLYVTSKKRATNYWTINATCKSCKVTYNIILKTKPEVGENYNFDIEMSDEHDLEKHTNKKVIIKGSQRAELAQSIIINHGGSVKSYYDAQAGLNLGNVPSIEAIKKVMKILFKKKQSLSL